MTWRFPPTSLRQRRAGRIATTLAELSKALPTIVLELMVDVKVAQFPSASLPG